MLIRFNRCTNLNDLISGEVSAMFSSLPSLQALKNTAMVTKIEDSVTAPQPCPPEEAMARTQRDTDKWARVIRDAKISVE